MDSQAQDWMRAFFESPKGFTSLPLITRGALVLLATEVGGGPVSFDAQAICAPLKADVEAFLRGLELARETGWLSDLSRRGEVYFATLTIPEET